MDVPAIHRLHEDVVNRIAAGEVIQRPANAIKEMLENSLDAGSKSIVITIKNGGLQLIQIQDDGHGIRKDDLEIVCERFTTSKLSAFDDLKKITTFGFRGEALASITHVANVTITSKTRNSPCAYRARYLDGRLVNANPGSIGAQPCAGVDGTQITVEDLFYNNATRRKALKNPSEQYKLILEVASRYAIHYASNGVSFCCKKFGQQGADLNTPKNSSVLNNIKIVFGQGVSRELIDFSVEHSRHSSIDRAMKEDNDIKVEFKAKGYVSNANFSMKKGVFILFINNRLVESSSIKKAFDSVYSAVLPNHAHPFIYLSLEMPTNHVDVNVHPTKKEVCFLNEDELIEVLMKKAEECLKGANVSRTFYSKGVQQPDLISSIDEGNSSSTPHHTGASAIVKKLPTLIVQDDTTTKEPKKNIIFAEENTKLKASTSHSQPTVYAHKLVRTDHTVGNLERYGYYARNENKNQKFKDERDSDEKVGEIGEQDEGFTNKRKRNSLTSNDTEIVDKECIECGEPQIEGDNSVPASNVFNSSTATTSSKMGGCDCCAKRRIGFVSTRSKSGNGKKENTKEATPVVTSQRPTRITTLVETSCQYQSVRNLIEDIKTRNHKGLSLMIKRHTFVGCVNSELSLIQYNTKLLLINHVALLKELVYQLAIRKFGCLGSLRIESGEVSVYEYLRAALDIESNVLDTQHLCKAEGNHSIHDKDQLCEELTELILANASMLKEYFNISFDVKRKTLLSLPQVLPNLTPDPNGIPAFLLRLATEVDYDDEQMCFESTADEIARFYCSSFYTTNNLNEEKSKEGEAKEATHLVEHVLYPSFRSLLLLPREFSTNGTVMQVASLEKLYRIFERC